MNHEQFIEKHVREELIRLGFPVPVAQGGIPGRVFIPAHVSGKPQGENFR
ncbi:hypothetical protein ATHEMM101B_14805 [Atlantibacter hermannii]